MLLPLLRRFLVLLSIMFFQRIAVIVINAPFLIAVADFGAFFRCASYTRGTIFICMMWWWRWCGRLLLRHNIVSRDVLVAVWSCFNTLMRMLCSSFATSFVRSPRVILNIDLVRDTYRKYMRMLDETWSKGGQWLRWSVVVPFTFPDFEDAIYNNLHFRRTSSSFVFLSLGLFYTFILLSRPFLTVRTYEYASSFIFSEVILLVQYL